MKRNWVFDASPLIILGKAELLTTISPLASCWFIPEGVVQEVSQKSAIEPLLLQLSENAKIERQSMESIQALIANWNLGDGESEAITLAMENSGYGVILDDLQARKCATVLNLPLIGSLGLIVKAKKEGLLEVAKPAFKKLIASGLYVAPQLIEKVLTYTGEK
jgi:predicted nucleic acid-binding protein